MYEKCIKCDRIGESCVPNIMLLPFPDLVQWCDKRQRHIGWTNQTLADKSRVPVGTISRIKAGDYLDCKYSTIRNILLALIGGTTDEFPCNAQVVLELQQLETLEKECEELKAQLGKIDETHRQDIRAVIAEHKEQITFLLGQIAFLEDQLRAR